MRPNPPEQPSGESTSAAIVLPPQPTRPPWIGLSALALAIGLALGLARGLLQLWMGAQAARPWGVPLLMAVLLLAGFGIAGLCIWQFWEGQNWARLVVLLWAVVTVVNALTFIADHDADAAALLARPVLFFQTVLAVFLLYWLNTGAVRAWFKGLSGGPAALIAERLVGKLCTGVEFHPGATNSPPGWQIVFEHGAELLLYSPWRIVLDDNLAFAYAPERGSEAPVISRSELESASMQDPAPNPAADSPQEARRLLKNLRVTAARIPPRTFDLIVSFEMGIELQTWQITGKSDAPQWQYRDPDMTVVADEQGIRPRPPVSAGAGQPAER